MRFESGRKHFEEVKVLASSMIRVIAEDGNCLFEITPRGKSSIEVCGIDICRVDGSLVGSRLQVVPELSNQIVIESRPDEIEEPGNGEA